MNRNNRSNTMRGEVFDFWKKIEEQENEKFSQGGRSLRAGRIKYGTISSTRGFEKERKQTSKFSPLGVRKVESSPVLSPEKKENAKPLPQFLRIGSPTSPRQQRVSRSASPRRNVPLPTPPSKTENTPNEAQNSVVATNTQTVNDVKKNDSANSFSSSRPLSPTQKKSIDRERSVSPRRQLPSPPARSSPLHKNPATRTKSSPVFQRNRSPPPKTPRKRPTSPPNTKSTSSLDSPSKSSDRPSSPLRSTSPNQNRPLPSPLLSQARKEIRATPSVKERRMKFLMRPQDIDSFWNIKVDEKTRAQDICHVASKKFKVPFALYEKERSGSLRKIASDANLLKTIGLEEKNHQLILQPAQREKAPKKTIPIDVDEGNVKASLAKLKIDPRWEIDLKDLQLEEVAGGGNFSKVYIGSYKGETVAIKKVLNTNTYDMEKYVQRELDFAQNLQHPKIVKFFGACQTEKAVFIVTEYVAKGDLSVLLKTDSIKLSWPLRIAMALDIAESICFCVENNFIHRDLKSANLLVQSDFSIKLCDFGLIREKSRIEKGMTVVGTDDWMAPELLLDEEYDEMADIYSFGMVLLEIITREKPPPRHPRNLFDIPREEVLEKAPKDCPKDFLNLALDCLNLEPSQRPRIQQIIETLKAIQAQRTSI